MHRIAKLVASAAGVTLAATIGLAVTGSAAVPTPTPGNVTMIQPVRDVNTPGIALANKATTTVQVTGKTGVPAAATGVIGILTPYQASAAGSLTAFTAGQGQPGTPTLAYSRASATVPSGPGATVTVPLNSAGQMAVGNVGGPTRFLFTVLGYVTPVPAACSATVATIAPAPVSLTHVGGSIRSGATDAGSVHLGAGTYDTRVLGNFTGLNSTNDAAFAGHELFGTMVLWTGDAIAPDFSNDITDGGHLIDQADSATLTVDPTTALSTFLTVPAGGEDVHVGFFAYLDNSGGLTGADAGNVKATIQSAAFRSVC